MPRIDLDPTTPLNLDHLPQGFTPEIAEEARALLLRLDALGLTALFAVASPDDGFQLAVGDAQTVHTLSRVMLEQSGRMFCTCPDCVRLRSSGQGTVHA